MTFFSINLFNFYLFQSSVFQVVDAFTKVCNFLNKYLAQIY